MVMLLMVRFSVTSCSRVQDVKRVAVDLFGFNVRSLSFVQLNISWRYGCRSYSAVEMSEWEAAGNISSVYVFSDTPVGGSGTSEVYRLKV